MFKAAATATAASAAFPPALSILWPASAANGCVHATMPLALCTTLRLLGKEINSGSEEGNMAEALRGIVRTSALNNGKVNRKYRGLQHKTQR